ncbi:unnamed protein product [Meloidogyne enterolobii]|uniref:Uncharacterized protein n=1 Tax=Meloidogyne enterolobii TaxID=390850 RepID=A0ACB0YEQ9_MELEN
MVLYIACLWCSTWWPVCGALHGLLFSTWWLVQYAFALHAPHAVWMLQLLLSIFF